MRVTHWTSLGRVGEELNTILASVGKYIASIEQYWSLWRRVGGKLTGTQNAFAKASEARYMSEAV